MPILNGGTSEWTNLNGGILYIYIIIYLFILYPSEAIHVLQRLQQGYKCDIKKKKYIYIYIYGLWFLITNYYYNMPPRLLLNGAQREW